jgi:signal transduction histidine kinase
MVRRRWPQHLVSSLFRLASKSQKAIIAKDLAVTVLTIALCLTARLGVIDELVGQDFAYFPYYPATLILGYYLGIEAGILAVTLTLLVVNSDGSWSPSNIIFINAVYFCLAALTVWLARKIRKVLISERHLRQAQTDFITMLAHEIKTPLSCIQTAASSLSVIATGDLAAGRIRSQKRAVEEITNIIDRCIEASRLESKSLHIECRTISIPILLRDIITSSADEDRIQLTCRTEVSVFSDPFIINCIVTNIINNAVKYSPKSSTINIAVSIERLKGRAGVVIKFINTLASNDTPDLEIMFNKYYRGPDAHASSGAGLGLWIVRKMARLIYCDVKVIRDNGEICFQLWLPLV